MAPPHTTEALADALHANCVTLPAGHSLMGEAPDEVLNQFQTFLAGSTP
jgi:pimeloyl-ACP methyl ester carboxylesterase